MAENFNDDLVMSFACMVDVSVYECVCVCDCVCTKHKRTNSIGWSKQFVVPHGSEWCLGNGNGQFDAHSVSALHGLCCRVVGLIKLCL